MANVQAGGQSAVPEAGERPLAVNGDQRLLQALTTEHFTLQTARKLSTPVRQVDQGFVVPGVPSLGLLIHAAAGSWGGVGGLRTNRSGWAA
jgi:hypothetical protein